MKKSQTFQLPGALIIGDCYEVIQRIHIPDNCYCFLDPPYEDEAISKAWRVFYAVTTALSCFMYPEQTQNIEGCDQICHWVKPVSTKNTKRKYSRVVEAIAIKHGAYFNQNLHWSARTGVFTDTLTEKNAHPHQKPFSLVEKLILLHTPPGGVVLDPFCGSRRVKSVCDKHGIKSISIDMINW